jgi:preprotein translocase SecE subunit
MGGMKVAESEEDFERPVPRPEPSAPAVSDANFRTAAHIAAFVAAFCISATLYFVGTPQVSGLRELPLNVWLGVAAAAFGGQAWFILKKLSSRLSYAKPGQGRWARLTGYVGFAVLALFGAVALHHLPDYASKWWGGEKGLADLPLLGARLTLRPVFFPAVAFFLGSMVGFHLFVNRPSAADFLVDTQGEMKRVSWPTRREWIGSTIVVLVLVIILSFFLYGADSVLSPMMQKFRIGF